MTDENQDPSWDPAVKRRVQHALDHLVFEVKDIVMRRTDTDGFYEPPGDVASFGDVTGLLGVGKHQLIQPLQAALDKARAELLQVWAEVDEHKRQDFGPGYQPPARDV